MRKIGGWKKLRKSMTFKVTPAEAHQTLLEIAEEQLKIILVLVRIYRKKPTEELELSIKGIKRNYDIWKKVNNL